MFLLSSGSLDVCTLVSPMGLLVHFTHSLYDNYIATHSLSKCGV